MIPKYTKGWHWDDEEKGVYYYPEDTNDEEFFTIVMSFWRYNLPQKDKVPAWVVYPSVLIEDMVNRKEICVGDLFAKWDKPTEDELILFEMEFNVSYKEPLSLFLKSIS